MIEATFCSEFDLQTNVFFRESLVVENTACASEWWGVITGICDQLFKMGVKTPNLCYLSTCTGLAVSTQKTKNSRIS